MIDWARVAELRNDLGGDGFDEVVELFLEEMDERLSAMLKETSQSRSQDLHFLKGCAANIGFVALWEISVAAEKDRLIGFEQIDMCYTQSKVAFLSDVRVCADQIRTPERTSSSVMSR